MLFERPAIGRDARLIGGPALILAAGRLQREKGVYLPDRTSSSGRRAIISRAAFERPSSPVGVLRTS